MIRIVLFVVCTLFFLYISRKAIKNPGSHGFYRFFVFEGVALLILLNHPYWFRDPFSPLHLLSWLLLALSIVFIIHSLLVLKQKGGYLERPEMPENFAFENTTNIVEEGLYRYVRHPMYSSLLFLAWGAFFKHITFCNTLLVFGVCALLVTLARVEEKENIRYFGAAYRSYMKRSRMFIPWLF